MTAIRGRRGERIVPEPAMERIVSRMNDRLNVIAAERDDLLWETRAAILEELDFPIRCSIRVIDVLQKSGQVVRVGLTPTACEEPAVVQVRCRACGRGNFLCESHRSTVLAHPAVMCMGCKASGPALVVYEFSPLAGA